MFLFINHKLKIRHCNLAFELKRKVLEIIYLAFLLKTNLKVRDLLTRHNVMLFHLSASVSI